MPTTVKLEERVRDDLRLLAAAEGISMTEKLQRMILAEKRRHLLDSVNAAYAELRSREADWQRELEERSALEGSLGDSLD